MHEAAQPRKKGRWEHRAIGPSSAEEGRQREVADFPRGPAAEEKEGVGHASLHCGYGSNRHVVEMCGWCNRRRMTGGGGKAVGKGRDNRKGRAPAI